VRRAWLAGGALALLLVAALLWLVPPADPPPAVEIAARRLFAVLDFQNRTGRSGPAWLSSALAEIAADELGRAAGLRRIAAHEVEPATRELGLTTREALGPEELRRLRRTLNADLVLLGSYGGGPGHLRIDLRVQDTARGETLAQATVLADEKEAVAATARMATQLREQLETASRAAARGGAVARPLAPQPEAARWYSEGLARLRLGELAAARDLLVRAVAADPQHALAHLALSTAWSGLGFEAQARSEAEKAIRLSGALSLEQRLQVKARAHDVKNQWADALLAHEALFDSSPGNLEHGLGLAAALTAAGRGPEALAVLDRLRGLPPPLRDDPRIDLQLAAASGQDLRRSLAAALAARGKAAGRGAPLLVASADLAAADAHLRSLQCPQATRLASTSLVTFERADHPRQAIAARTLIAGCLLRQNLPQAALEMSDENLTASDRIGDRRTSVSMLQYGGLALRVMGRIAEARPRLERALTLAREVDDQRSAAAILGILVEAQVMAGDVPGAVALSRQAIHQSRRHARDQLPTHLTMGAMLLIFTGALEESRRLLAEAIALARQQRNDQQLAAALLTEAIYLLQAGQLEEARRTLASARDLAARQRPPAKLPVYDGTDGSMAFHQGNLAEAEARARRAMSSFVPPTLNHNIAFGVRLLLSQIALARGNVAGARGEMEAARALDVYPLPPYVAAEPEIIHARIEAAEGRKAAARRRLRALLATCRRQQMLPHELQAQLALLEIGPPSPGKARALSARARRHGLLLTARRAAALVDRPRTRAGLSRRGW
jgi:tetratricopeptide (TPR) repeat protein